jgi:hypothetical protein
MGANVPASCRDSCRSHSVKRDEICKALEKGPKEIPRRLVHEATVGLELLVRVSDENLRLQECVRVREYKCLAQLRLAARGSGHPGRGLDGRRMRGHDPAVLPPVSRRLRCGEVRLGPTPPARDGQTKLRSILRPRPMPRA